MLTHRTILCGVGVCLFAFSGVAIATPPRPPLTTALVAQSSSSTRMLQQRIQQDLASRLNVAPSRLQIIETTAQTWPDQCLGLARPYERCRGGEVKGWLVTVASPQQMWILPQRSQRSKTQARTPTERTRFWQWRLFCHHQPSPSGGRCQAGGRCSRSAGGAGGAACHLGWLPRHLSDAGSSLYNDCLVWFQNPSHRR
ncbi:MAG: hypothetical protein HC940_10220 [Acaryochloris sp. SU_5_25]|nr:hypothetical protein [Acaryochloris sp. SU_5_25]